jgi:hypothetical protein
MGGRRASSVGEIVGIGLSAQKGQFKKALASEDPEAIARASAKLIAQSERVGDILFYASKLEGFVRKHLESGEQLSYEQRMALARREWSRIKREEKIPDDPIITTAVVTAAAKAIGKG